MNRVPGAVLIAFAWLLAGAAEHGRAVAASASATRIFVCHTDPGGFWQNTQCPDGVDCKASCDAYPHCDAGSYAHAVADCSRERNCTLLVLHRRLSRLGCHFDPDTFWASPNARPQRELKTDAHTRQRVIDFGNSSCRDSDVERIKRELNRNNPFSATPQGRHLAYAALLSHGCNVDLALMGPDGAYAQVELSRDKPDLSDATGSAPQPRLLVRFEPEQSSQHKPPDVASPTCDGKDCVTPGRPLEESTMPVCDALARFGAAHRFPVCAPATGDSGVSIHILPVDGDTSGFTQKVAVVPSVSPLPPAPPPAPPPPPAPSITVPPTVAVAGAAGTLGLGALLAALARWLFTRSANKSSDNNTGPIFATHDVQDVHVAVAFAGKPRLRVRRAKRARSLSDNKRAGP